MIQNLILPQILLASSILALTGCQANGGSTGGNSGTGNQGSGIASVNADDGIGPDGELTGAGGGSDTGFPNDPLGPGGDTVGGLILAQDADGNDMEVAYGATNKRFRCIASGADTTEAGANGLVGGVVGSILGSVGGQSANDMLNGIDEPLQAIDHDLKTASTFTLTASALVGQVDSLEQVFTYDTPRSSGFAVAALSFPAGAVDLSMMRTVALSTYLDEGDTQSTVPSEPDVPGDATTVDLLGVDGFGGGRIFLGRQVTQPFNRIVISLSGDLLSADVGEAMYVHEVCVDGVIVDVPADPPAQ